MRGGGAASSRTCCCPLEHFHGGVNLLGRRWLAPHFRRFLHEAVNQVAADAVELDAYLMLGGFGAWFVEVEYQTAT